MGESLLKRISDVVSYVPEKVNCAFRTYLSKNSDVEISGDNLLYILPRDVFKDLGGRKKDFTEDNNL